MKNKDTVRKIEGLIELLILTLIFYYFWREKVFTWEYDFLRPYYGRGKYVLMAIYFILMLVIVHLCDGFKFGLLKQTDVLFSQWISILIVNTVNYLQLSLMANELIAVKPIIHMTLVDFVVSFVCIVIFFQLYDNHSKAAKLIMVYGNKDSVLLKPKMDTRGDNYNIQKLVPIEEGIQKIEEQLGEYDGLVICDVHAKERNELLKYCYMHGIESYITPKISDVIMAGGMSIHQFDTPLIMVKKPGLSPDQAFVKRFCDIVLSTIAAVVLSPLMLIVALAIKIDDGGAVFYRQKRVTKDGKVFEILKFRSMVEDAEQRPACDDDDRITKVGHFTRATRIDELPQLFNIIKGDMSIVGPRPERVEHVEKYTDAIPEFELRNKVKGGLTGFAQVYGKYNTSAYDKLKLDLMYIENYSFLLDVKLVLMTIRVLFKKESTEGFDKVLTPEEVLEANKSEED